MSETDEMSSIKAVAMGRIVAMRRMNRARRLITFLVLIAATTLGATHTSRAANLTGTVSDGASREALGFVNVVAILLADENERRGASSDGDGVYLIEKLRPGTYRVMASRIGYETRTDTVRVTEPVSRFDIRMSESALPFDPVDVTGDRLAKEKEVQTGLVSLDTEALKALPSIGEFDPIRSLQLLPGVQAASDISSGLYIRGGGPDQTLVLLDQVPVYNPTHAFGFFSTFNGDLVDRVKLYKGAYPAEYGGRLGGVVEIQTKDPKVDEFEGFAGLSTITSRVTMQGKAGSRGGWLFGARRTFLEPLLSAIRTEDNEIPSYYFYDLNGKYFYESRDGDQVTVSAYNGRDNLRFDLDEDSFINLRWGNTLLSTSYSHIFATAFLTNFRLSMSEYRSDNDVQIFTTPFSVDNRLFDLSARADVTYELNSNRRWTTGVLASTYKFEFKQTFNEDEQLDYERTPYDVSVYIQDDWQATETTRIQTGLRGRYFSDGDRYLAEPRFSIGQRLNDQWRMKLGGGLYNQYLQLITTEGFSAGDFYVPIDETAEPGQSKQIVFGLEYEPSDEFQYTAEYYFTDLANLVVLDNRVTPDQEEITAETLFVTDGSGWASGVELFAQRRVGNLTGWIGYTLGWTRRTFSELNGGDPFPPKYDRRNDFSAVATWKRGPWTYGASLVYGTGQAFTPATALYALQNPTEDLYEVFVLPGERNSARLLPYHRMDVSVTRDFTMFGKQAKWMVQVFNIYSRRNEWFVQYNTEDLSTMPEVFKMLPLIPSLGVEFDF